MVIVVYAMLSGLVMLASLHERAGAPPSEALMVVLGTWVHALWGVPTP
ncbi:MAG: hypothetical protein IPI43_27430 [Sandaracinaceae bacterium]|nr:hypothetical protein [Sandaracinaceae bacterium]